MSCNPMHHTLQPRVPTLQPCISQVRLFAEGAAEAAEAGAGASARAHERGSTCEGLCERRCSQGAGAKVLRGRGGGARAIGAGGQQPHGWVYSRRAATATAACGEHRQRCSSGGGRQGSDRHRRPDRCRSRARTYASASASASAHARARAHAQLCPSSEAAAARRRLLPHCAAPHRSASRRAAPCHLYRAAYRHLHRAAPHRRLLLPRHTRGGQAAAPSAAPAPAPAPAVPAAAPTPGDGGGAAFLRHRARARPPNGISGGAHPVSLACRQLPAVVG